MNKIISRLLVFFIGLPLVITFVWFTNYNHIFLNIVLIFVSIVGINETYNIFSKQLKLQSKFLVHTLGIIISLTSLICSFFNLTYDYVTIVFIFCLLISMIIEVFPQNENEMFEFSISKVAYTILILLYIPFLLSFISRMSLWENSRWFLTLFLLMVYGCDSLAWFFGMLFGKGNRGFVKASPNKSIAGFLGGIFTSVLCGIAAHFIFPEIFTSLWKIIVLALTTSTLAIFGDLIESVFKRSSSVKDSGQVIPGRGGLLDSIDSVLTAAPIYYFLCKLFFKI